jgi:hypothetical protein
MSWFCILFPLLLQIHDPTTVPDFPKTAGVYYLQSDTGWINLPPAPIADMKIKGMDMFVRSGGYTSLIMNIECRGSRALMRVKAPKPAFFVRGIGSSKDAMLIRLATQRNKRTFRTSSSAATVENKGGFDEEDIRKLDLIPYPDNSFSITPREDLKSGEYLLVLGGAATSFDFGID